MKMVMPVPMKRLAKTRWLRTETRAAFLRVQSRRGPEIEAPLLYRFSCALRAGRCIVVIARSDNDAANDRCSAKESE